MNFVIAFALVQATHSVEALPIDSVLAAFEAAVPEVAEIQGRIEEEIGRLGTAEPGWAESGLSAEAALEAAGASPSENVLGEWEAGGHGVVTPGHAPLVIPTTMRRYSIREYDGAVDYHTYHRPVPGIVIHTFGSVNRNGSAACGEGSGAELISQEAWETWDPRTALQIYSLARLTRDDRRIYCMLYRPTGDGGFSQIAFTPEGLPYLAANEAPQSFVPTPRAQAQARIFAPAGPSSTPME